MLVTREPQHLEAIFAGEVLVRPSYDRTDEMAVPNALLWRATGLAIESAFLFGEDMPVGATIGNGTEQAAGSFASDQRTGNDELHAERYALKRSSSYGIEPELLGVSMEPCSPCQDAIRGYGVETCYFALSRNQVADTGLVNRRQSLLDYKDPSRKPRFVQIKEPRIVEINLTILNSTNRNPYTGEVSIDTVRLLDDLTKFDEVSALV